MTPIEEAISILKRTPVFQCVVLSSTLKHYQNDFNCFWDNKDIKDINEEYYKKLKIFNGDHVKRISWFWKRPDPGPERISSLFWDSRGWPEMIEFAIQRINHNQIHVLELCKMLRDNQYKKMDSFKDDVKKYIDKQINNQKFEILPKATKDYQFHYRKPVKDNSFADYEINQFEYNEKYYPNYHYKTDHIKNFLCSELIYCSGGFEIKEKVGTPLSQETLKKLEDQDFDGLTFDQCVEAISHYKLFVSEDDYPKFFSRFKRIEQHKFSLFDDIVVDLFRDVIKEFFSYPTLQATDYKMMVLERTKVIKEFEKTFYDYYLNNNFDDMCCLIDVLGVFYRRGYEFITRNGFRVLNDVFRKYNLDSTNNWICFDPLWSDEWKVMKKYNELPSSKLLAYIIYQFLTINSSLVLEVFDLAKSRLTYDELNKEVKSRILKYKRKIRSHLIFY